MKVQILKKNFGSTNRINGNTGYACKPIVLFTFILSMFLSCSKDDNPMDNNQQQDIKGRFDNSPFVWDESNSTRPADDIYIGDMNVCLVSDDGSLTRSVASTGNSSDNLFIYIPVNIYAGAVYPKSSLPNKLGDEIALERNPIDVVYNFNDPFIDSITKETGSSGYKKSFKAAMISKEYHKHLAAGKADLEYYFTQFKTSSDLEKALSGNVSLGRIFSDNTAKNSKKLNIQSRVFVKLVSVNFSVNMDAPAASKGFFKDSSYNNKLGFKEENLPVYIRSLTYGRVVYMAIESEYSYSEVGQALKAAIKYKFKGVSMDTDKQVIKIVSKSTVTLFAIADDTPSAFFVGGLSDLSSIFETNYSSIAYGYPIYLQGRYVYDNSTYHPTNPASDNRNRRHR